MRAVARIGVRGVKHIIKQSRPHCASRASYAALAAPATAHDGHFTQASLLLLSGLAAAGAVAASEQRSVLAEEDASLTECDPAKVAELKMRSTRTHAQIFASLASSSRNGEPYMTFRDLLRSRLYHQYDFHGPLGFKDRLKSEQFVGDYAGRISFPEFVFLKTIMTVPEDCIAVAFLMVDTDQNGMLDAAELAQGIQLMAANPELPLEHCLQHRLSSHLFGKDGKKPVSFQAFRAFVHQLKKDMLQSEFFHYSQGHKIMTYRQFARYLIAHSAPNRIQRRMKRLQAVTDVAGSGFTLRQFTEFNFAVIEHASSVAEAIELLDRPNGRGLTVVDLSNVLKAVSGKNFPPQLVKTLFLVFDENDDGHLDATELVGIINRRALHAAGRDKPPQSSFASFTECVATGDSGLLG